MIYEKIVTLYDTAEHAEAARRNLEAAGFPPSEISMLTNKTLTAAGEKLREPGLWHRLFGRDIEQHEAVVYGHTVESGGAILTVRVAETEVAKAMGILNAHKVVDVQNRAVQQGLISSAPVPQPAAAPAQPATTAAAGAVSGEQVFGLAEEQLNVGKERVETGRTRVRRFVTEKDVAADVTLHEEHAEVIRKAISDPKFVGDIDWADEDIEVVESAEHALVNKTARIVEEIGLKQVGTEHVETIRDKIRRQQVEIQQLDAQGRVIPPKTT